MAGEEVPLSQEMDEKYGARDPQLQVCDRVCLRYESRYESELDQLDQIPPLYVNG